MRSLRTKVNLRNFRTKILIALIASLKRHMSSLSFRVKLGFVAVACLTLAAITTTIASNPGTTNITVPTSAGQKV